MTPAELFRARRDGDLERVRRGSYALPEKLDDPARHRRLAVATVPLLAEGSVLSHTTAAVIHGLPITGDRLERVWVTRPGSGHGRRGPVVHLRRSPLTASDVAAVDGLTVTSLARTAVDVARESPFEWGVVVCDAVLARGISRDELAEVAERTRRWPGGRRAWSAVRFADPQSGSPAESLSRVQIDRLRLPTPATQFRVVLNGSVVATTDFGWEDDRLVGECDGRAKYGELLRPGETPADAVMREKRREERIRQAGFWIVRWGWREANDPAELGRILRRAFELAPGGPLQSRPWSA
jgi:Predicted transcriptional regulator